MNQEMLEIARKFHEQDKAQDALVESNRRDIARVLNKAKLANSQIDEVSKAIDGQGTGRICVYITIICLIIAVAYGIYTVVEGEDPCKQANSSSDKNCV